MNVLIRNKMLKYAIEIWKIEFELNMLNSDMQRAFCDTGGHKLRYFMLESNYELGKC